MFPESFIMVSGKIFERLTSKRKGNGIMNLSVENGAEQKNVSASVHKGCIFNLDKIFLNVKSPKLLVREGRILNSEAFVRVSVEN